MPGGWAGSDRRARLPKNWRTEIRPAVHRKNPRHICHVCGEPGGDAVDHIRQGDDHSIDNLDWIHQDVAPYCHRRKTAAEGNAARKKLMQRHRPPPEHPALR